MRVSLLRNRMLVSLLPCCGLTQQTWCAFLIIMARFQCLINSPNFPSGYSLSYSMSLAEAIQERVSPLTGASSNSGCQDTVVFVVTMTCLWRHSRNSKNLYPTSLLFLLVRDGKFQHFKMSCTCLHLRFETPSRYLFYCQCLF